MRKRTTEIKIASLVFGNSSRRLADAGFRGSAGKPCAARLGVVTTALNACVHAGEIMCEVGVSC